MRELLRDGAGGGYVSLINKIVQRWGIQATTTTKKTSKRPKKAMTKQQKLDEEKMIQIENLHLIKFN